MEMGMFAARPIFSRTVRPRLQQRGLTAQLKTDDDFGFP